MKKTLTINISGMIFNIDEDSFNKLQNYLEDINARFSNAEEGHEIISDIEARIAELFNGKINPQKQVITIEDLDEVIGIMGNPSDFGGDNNTEHESGNKSNSEKTTGKKRIYRDTDNRVLGGVCSGLGAYFNIDPVFLRILMVISFFAFGPLLYIILWIAIPKAKTTAQKLEMKGEKVNISNIEKSIREEFEEVKQNFKNINKSKIYSEGQTIIEKIGNLFITVFGSLAKLVVVFIGIILLIVGLALLVGFLSTAIFGVSDISVGDSALSVSQFLGMFLEKNDTSMLFVSLIVIIAIPILSIIYGGIKLIFKIKKGNKIIGLGLTALWLICFVYIIVVGLGETQNFKVTNNYETKMTIDEKIDTLIFKKIIDTKNSESGNFDIDDTEVDITDGVPIIKGKPQIAIIKNDSNSVEISVKRFSRGKNKKLAHENARVIHYEWYCEETKNLSKHFSFEGKYDVNTGGKWRKPRVEVTIKVPEGKILFIDKNMTDLLYNIENLQGLCDEDMAGKTWIMKKDGLCLIK